MGGSNEFVECFCGGAVAEGGSGAVVEFVGDGVEVGLVAGDGGSFGKVSADESDRKSTRLNSSHWKQSRMPSSA